MKAPDDDVQLDLDCEEAELLRRFVEGHYAAGRRPKGSFCDYLARWPRLVRRVEEGYALTIYDYANDLYIRKGLEDLKNEVPPSLRQKLSDWLEPWDRRFEEATRPSDRPVLFPRLERSDGEWFFRVPKRMGPELKKDLRNEGLL